MSDPGAPRLVHQVKRRDGNIDRELPVCPLCHRSLAAGHDLHRLMKMRRSEVKRRDTVVAIDTSSGQTRLVEVQTAVPIVPVVITAPKNRRII